MAIGGLARDRLESHSAHARRGPGEVAVDHLPVEADGLENLRPAIALHGRDAHLGGDLDQALYHRLVEVLDRALLVDVLEDALVDHPGHRGVREVRIDRAGAIADQQAEVLRLARLARLDHQPGAGARALANQMMMHGAGCEQARNRRVFAVHAAVGEHDYRRAVGDRLGSAAAQALERAAQPGLAVGDAIERRERDRAQARRVEPLDLFQLARWSAPDATA